MTDGVRGVLLGLGLVMAIIAAGAVLGAYPRSFSGSGGGRWIPGSHNLPFAALAGILAALHLWAAFSDRDSAPKVAYAVAVIGLVLGLALVVAQPIVGFVLLVAYAYVVRRLLAVEPAGGVSELRRHLRSRRRPPPDADGQ